MRPDVWRAWEQSDDDLFGLFIGSLSFKNVNTAPVGVSWGSVKFGAKTQGELIDDR